MDFLQLSLLNLQLYILAVFRLNLSRLQLETYQEFFPLNICRNFVSYLYKALADFPALCLAGFIVLAAPFWYKKPKDCVRIPPFIVGNVHKTPTQIIAAFSKFLLRDLRRMRKRRELQRMKNFIECSHNCVAFFLALFNFLSFLIPFWWLVARCTLLAPKLLAGSHS